VRVLVCAKSIAGIKVISTHPAIKSILFLIVLVLVECLFVKSDDIMQQHFSDRLLFLENMIAITCLVNLFCP